MASGSPSDHLQVLWLDNNGCAGVFHSPVVLGGSSSGGGAPVPVPVSGLVHVFVGFLDDDGLPGAWGAPLPCAGSLRARAPLPWGGGGNAVSHHMSMGR